MFNARGKLRTMRDMQVELCHERQKTGEFVVDLVEQPSKVTVNPSGEELFLDWNSTLDDSGCLRGCVICGGDVYQEQTFPQVTGIVVVLAFAGGVAGILGLVTTWPMLIAMGVVLILDILILALRQSRLVCYNCQTKYSKLIIASYHHRWDADRNEQIKRSCS